MPPERRYLFVLAGLLLAALAVTRVELFIRWQVNPKLDSNLVTLKKNFPLYKEDSEIVRKSSLLPLGTARKLAHSDAGSYLNSRLAWIPKAVSSTGAKTSLVSKDIREQLLRYENRWMPHYSRLEQMPADLSLFKDLARFDFWDLESASPIATLTARAKFVPPSDLPIPDPEDLIALSKLRLMTAVTEESPVDALKQVHQLGLLLLTTENSQMIATGLAVLEDEINAYHYLVHGKYLAPQLWTPLDPLLIRRARRVAYATRGYLHLWTPKEMLKTIFLSEKEPPGFCAAMNDALPLEFSLRPFLEPHLPFERDFSSEYAELDAIVRRARTSCRLHYFGQIFDQGKIQGTLPGPRLLNHLPFWRKLFALKSSVYNFTGFELYDRLFLPKAAEPDLDSKENF
jgi:hypothetical protein